MHALPSLKDVIFGLFQYLCVRLDEQLSRKKTPAEMEQMKNQYLTVFLHMEAAAE